MLFAVSLMIPLLVLAVWLFWRLSPPRPDARTLRAYNVGVCALALLLAAAIAWYVRGSMAESTDHGLWPLVTAYYVMAVVPLWLAVAGGLRRLIFGAREPVKPLEISQDLSKTRF
jgi:thiol:disulfide interchange protein